MRAVVLSLLLLSLVSACGGKRAAKAETATAGSTVMANVVGDVFKGKAFFRGYCSGCHTLKAAGATGRVGPDLDKLKPSYARVVKQVTTGGTGGQGVPLSMLTFGPDTFTAAEIRDIAAFVSSSTHETGCVARRVCLRGIEVLERGDALACECPRAR